MTGIYIHVPFCAKKCPYCDFYSRPYRLSDAQAYKDAVIRNIEALPETKADTVYFGGGTPSILPAGYIAEIIDALSKRVCLVEPEITLEVNPKTVSRDKLIMYKSMGINRISIGIQSGSDAELSFLGRRHTFEDGANAAETAFSVGFENISCDIMIGTEGQTEDSLETSVNRITALPVKHISSYILKVEEGTEFGRNGISERLPDDDSVAGLYLHGVKLLEDKGFRQYEVSNFSVEGFESRHNLKYWKCGEYIGIGPSAHSFYGGRRYFVPNDLDKFCESEVQERVYEERPAGDEDERIMLGLRLAEGIDPNDFPRSRDRILSKAKRYCGAGLAVFEGRRLRLTPEGFLVSNPIIGDIIYNE